MLISCSLSNGKKVTTPEEAAEWLAQAGFDAIDLSMTKHQLRPDLIALPDWREDILRDCEAAKKAGLAIGQCHMPFYNANIAKPGDGGAEDFMDFMLPSYIRAISLCGEVGCTVAVMHPYYKDGDARTTEDGNVRILEELLPYAEKNRVKLAIENIYGQVYGETGEKGPLTLHDCGMSQPDAIIRVLDRVSSPFAGACLDTGHANVFRIHIGNAARALGRRLIALHVNGNSGQDEHAIPFTISSWCEKMDYRDFAHALKEIGYKGTYNLETETGSLPASCVPSYYAFAAQTARALSEPEEE